MRDKSLNICLICNSVIDLKRKPFYRDVNSDVDSPEEYVLTTRYPCFNESLFSFAGDLTRRLAGILFCFCLNSASDVDIF